MIFIISNIVKYRYSEDISRCSIALYNIWTIICNMLKYIYMEDTAICLIALYKKMDYQVGNKLRYMCVYILCFRDCRVHSTTRTKSMVASL
jgi:hypothetical protein